MQAGVSEESMERHFKVFSVSPAFVAPAEQEEKRKLSSRFEIGNHSKVAVIWLLPDESTPGTALWMLVENDKVVCNGHKAKAIRTGCTNSCNFFDACWK